MIGTGDTMSDVRPTEAATTPSRGVVIETRPSDPRALLSIRRLARALAVALGVFMVVITGAVTASVTTVHPDSEVGAAGPSMLAVAPGGVLDPEVVSDPLAANYHSAEAHSEAFAAVPCYCGCEEMLDHRHLLDCFIRADGTGWEAHAAGCEVCLGEAEQVAGLIAAGVTDIDEIRAAVAAEWGDPYQQ